MKKDVVIVDIDGTLADISHRLHFIKNGNRDWDNFNAGISDDKPKGEIVQLVQLLYDAGISIYLKTGRFRKYVKETLAWLQKHKIPFDHLEMRTDGDYRSDYEVKQSMLDNMSDEKRILFVIDDRQQVVDMWRKNGLTCLQCQKGDY